MIAEDEIYFLSLSLSLIQQKLNWPDCTQWTSYHFEKLSTLIEEATGVVISADTFKRLAGKRKTKKDFYNPHRDTKNFISSYLGFTNWDDFKVRNSHISDAKTESVIINENYPVVEPKKPSIKILPIFTYIFFGAIALTTAFLSFLYFAEPTGKISISTSEGYVPYSVYINTTVNTNFFHEVWLDLGYYEKTQYYKDRLPFQIKNKMEQNSHCYFTPFYHIVKLYENNKTIDSAFVHILSKGWDVRIRPDNKLGGVIKPDTLNGALHVQYKEVEKFGIIKSDNYNIDYCISKIFPIDCDNFTFETRVKNNVLEDGIEPNDIIVQFKGEKALSHVIEFLSEGSHKWGLYRASEVLKNGDQYPELSVFGVNFNQWHTIRLEIKNGVANTFLDDRPIYSQAYTYPLGQMKVMGITFKGSGWIDYVQMIDAEGDTVMNDNF